MYPIGGVGDLLFCFFVKGAKTNISEPIPQNYFRGWGGLGEATDVILIFLII